MTARTRRIAEEIVIARITGVPWKFLVRRYGLCRARLYQLQQAHIEIMKEAA